MNEAKKTLTMEFIESIMDENYTLVWVDYRESFDENRDLLQKCLEKQGCEDLWSKVEDWYEDAEEQATQEIIKGLKSHCIDFHDFEKDEVEAFFEEHDDEIRDEIHERDDSTTVNDLIKNTNDIPIRVEVLSNYDCINSCWLESQGGFRYQGELLRGYDRYSSPQPCKGEESIDGERLHRIWQVPEQEVS